MLKDLPPRSTVKDYLRRWADDDTRNRIDHALNVHCREQAGREASPSAATVVGYPILKNVVALPTDSHDRMIPGIAPATTAAAGRQLLREVARNVVAETVKNALAQAS